jgi:hypothetical protein
MNTKRGFQRIFVVLVILWLIPVAILTVYLMPKKQEVPNIHKGEREPNGFEKWQQENISQGFAKEDLSLYSNEELLRMRNKDFSDLPSPDILRRRAAIRELQRRGKLPSDPNLVYKPPSFWQSEEGKKLFQQGNIESERNLREQQSKFIFRGFLFWVIPLIFVYLMGVLIWWIIVGFRGRKA